MSVALVVMATSCKKDDQVISPVNDGEENVLYSYYSATQGFCGTSIATIGNKMKDLGFTQAGTDKYQLVCKEYVVTIDYVDADKNESIDILNVTFTPAEQKHDKTLTFDYIKEFMNAVGNEVKLFSTNPTYCRYYGFYDVNGKWVGEIGDLTGLLESELKENNISGGYAFWLGKDLEKYDPSFKAPNEFTGMYIHPTTATAANPGEYNVVISFVINQTLEF